MSGNTFGTIFKLTSFGESHGPAIGGVVDGCPAGLIIDVDFIHRELLKRKTGHSFHASSRKENDEVEFLAGIFENKSTGTPIGFLIRNSDQRTGDYDHLKDLYRPSHGDYTYERKYGIRDYRGGGRSSARETAVRVVGGAIAKLILQQYGINCKAYVSAIGPIGLDKPISELDLGFTDKSPIGCPDEDVSNSMVNILEKTYQDGDTLGGKISCIIKGVPTGLGEPVFDKLQADLGKAMLGINAAKGFEFGSGFGCIKMKGSEHNDIFYTDKNRPGEVRTRTNFSGGIQAGISNGEDIYFNVAFKPVSSLMKKQATIDRSGKQVVIIPRGRYDTCVVPRAVPVVEAMAAIVITDHLLRNRSNKI